MAFVVEDGTGLPTATAYCTVVFMREVCLVEGHDVTGHSDQALELAIQRATRYIDSQFRFIGYRHNETQRLEWPRQFAYYRDGRLALGVPREVQEACALYAFRSLAAALAPDPTYDESGARVVAKSQTVGPIEESVEFAADGALASRRIYPAVDALLKQFVLSGHWLERV